MARRKVWTQISVNNIRAKAKRVEWPDPEQRGLWLVVQPTGVKSWAVRYRRKADLRPRKLTLPGFVSLGMARKLTLDALDRVANGADPAADKQADRRAAKLLAKHGPTIGTASTIDDALAHYLAKVDRQKGWRAATRYENGRMLGFKRDGAGRWIKSGGAVIDRWSGRPLASITRADVRSLINDLAEQAPKGANRTLATLKAAFSWLVSEDLLAVSPADGVNKPAPEKSRDRASSDPDRGVWRGRRRRGISDRRYDQVADPQRLPSR